MSVAQEGKDTFTKRQQYPIKHSGHCVCLASLSLGLNPSTL